MGSITDVTHSTPALDFSTFDTDVRVQDDLFRHVNGTWIDQTPIPDDKPLTGSFMVLRDAAEEAVRDIITGMDRSTAAPGSDEAKIADLYASFMATDVIEAAGAQPISELLARIDAVTEIPEHLRKRAEEALARREEQLAEAVWVVPAVRTDRRS